MTWLSFIIYVNLKVFWGDLLSLAVRGTTACDFMSMIKDIAKLSSCVSVADTVVKFSRSDWLYSIYSLVALN